MVDGSEVSTESEIWNIAKGYSGFKVLVPLVELSKLFRVMNYGCDTVEQSYVMNEHLRNNMRHEAAKRIIDCYKDLLDDTHFAWKKNDKDKIDDIRTSINVAEIILDNSIETRSNNVAHTENLSIDGAKFNKFVDKVRCIKRELLVILNNASLIFPSSDELDMNAIKEQLIQGG